MEIWVLSDGKPGHLNQSLGLTYALLDKIPGHLSIIDLSGRSFFEKLRLISKQSDLPTPDIIIGTGHGTHIALLKARNLFKVPTIVCMKPSLPACFFSLCIIPRHDIPPHKSHAKNSFTTIGAIHQIKPAPEQDKTHTLILIGGPSKEYNWNPSLLKKHLLEQIEPNTEGEIILTTSRRTPSDFSDELARAKTRLQVFPVEETKQGWVSEHLAKAKTVWVTEDSVSMVYEALGSGAPVGIIPMPRKSGKPSRVAYGLSLLINEKRVTPLSDWLENENFYPSPPLLEADKAADHIINTFPQLKQTT